MALRYHSHPSLITYNMMEFCDQYINLLPEGRSSGLVLKVNIPSKDVNSSYSCATALKAPRNYHVLISLKKIEISAPNRSCPNYMTIFDGGLNSTRALTNRICGYYNEIHAPPIAYYPNLNPSALTIRISKEARAVDNQDFGFTLTTTVFSRSRKGVCPGPDQMLCDNQFCVWKYFKCNGYNNCGDRSDEKECDVHITANKRNKDGNSYAYIAFLGAVMVLIIVIILLVVSRFTNQSCCCHSSRSARDVSRQRASTCEVSVISTADQETSNQPPPYAYDNDGYDTEPPPSYEEALALFQSQGRNESYAVPVGRYALPIVPEASPPRTAAPSGRSDARRTLQ